MTGWLIWLGIALCLCQSAIFSGMNLAVFSIPRLTLEIAAARHDRAAKKLLAFRRDSNFLLVTILLGNVSINVLLTLLSDSVMAGVAAFLFSTVMITLCGEIFPQAYFSRNALRMAALFAPLLRFYQFILFPLAKPVALLLDVWLGKEGIQWMRERELKDVIRKHVEAEDAADVEHVEGIGALNFLSIDDMAAAQEGEPVDPASIISLPVRLDLPVVPDFKRDASDPFLQQVQASGRKWVILTGDDGVPLIVLDADGLLRSALLGPEKAIDPYQFCHRPLIVEDPTVPLGDLIWRLKLRSHLEGDEAIDQDVILVWTPDQRRIITGADILGRLFRGIARDPEQPKAKPTESPGAEGPGAEGPGAAGPVEAAPVS